MALKAESTITLLEIAYAQKSPVMQGEHILEDDESYRLYDNLVCTLKEHRRYRIHKDTEF